MPSGEMRARRCLVVGLTLGMMSSLVLAAGAKPAPVDEYLIHPDGGIVYDPQRREAAKTGQLGRYRDAAVTEQDLRLDGCRLRVRVPKRAQAYDVVPLAYELSWDEGGRQGEAGVPAGRRGHGV